jgi:DNA polymerase-3 subunit epsilon
MSQPPATPEVVSRSQFAVVDVETSGLSVRRHRILQLGVVIADAEGAVLDQWSTLVRLRWPFQRVGPTEVHGLHRRTLRGAPTLRDVVRDLAPRVDGMVLVGHNIDFDAEFIERAARRSGTELRLGERLCTLRLSRALDPDRLLSHRLVDVAARYGVTVARPHDALADAQATAAVLPHLLHAHGVELDGDDVGDTIARLARSVSVDAIGTH